MYHWSMTINDVAQQLGTFLTWVGGIAAGTTIAYFMLTHLAGHVFHNVMWFITIGIMFTLFSLFIQPQLNVWLPILQWQAQLVYSAIPYEKALHIWDMILLAISVRIYALTAHPHAHG